MRKFLVFLPLLIILILGAFFAWGLNPSRDPNAVPSALVGQEVPQFDLPGIENVDADGLNTARILEPDEITLVNFFASWCVPCRAEHGVLTALARDEGLALFGINYKDKPEDAARWLAELGNPYLDIGKDESGRASLEWGLSGVPETFMINQDNVIIHRFRGPIVGPTAKQEFMEILSTVRGGAN